jgi:hypothetical protein
MHPVYRTTIPDEVKVKGVEIYIERYRVEIFIRCIGPQIPGNDQGAP